MKKFDLNINIKMLKLLKGVKVASHFFSKGNKQVYSSFKGSRLTDSFVKVNNLFHIKINKHVETSIWSF